GLQLHQEAEGVASLLASKAVVDLLGRADRKRRGLLRVERAESIHGVPARLPELQITRNDLDDVGALSDRLDVLLPDPSCHTSGSSLPRSRPARPGSARSYNNQPWGRKSCSYVRNANRSVIPAM